YPFGTRTITTPSGGQHLYFAHPGHPFPPVSSSTGGLGPFIDVRAHGGYVVAPPSRTSDGLYTTLNPAPPAPLPAWLAAALAPSRAPRLPDTAPQVPTVIPGGSDHYALAAFAGEVD